MNVTLQQIATTLGIAPPADAQRVLCGVANLDSAAEDQLSFLGAQPFVKEFLASRAKIVLVTRKVKLPPDHGKTVLEVDDAELALIKILPLFARPLAALKAGVDPSARVDPSAKLGENVAIAEHVVISANCTIGKNTVIHPGVVICEGVTIGDNCLIYPNVVLREWVQIGNRVILHANCTIGSDGFGYRWDDKQMKHVKIPHIGTVVIEDDVEIGSGTCIDRAKFSQTKIGQGTKIDNLVQVGHNTVMGKHCIICGMVGMAGSITMGNGVVIGGGVAIRDHITMGDRSGASGNTGIGADVEPGTIVSGYPAVNHRQWLREQSATKRLPALIEKVRELAAEIEKLKNKS